jgi:hypothetical protein
MSAPSASDLKTAIIGQLPSDFKTGGTEIPKGEGGIPKALDDWLQAVCTGISTAWSTWQSTVKFGGASVTGLGIGTWTGVGSGGAFNASLSLNLNSMYGTVGETKMIGAVKDKFQAAFNAWVSGFALVACPFNGTSTATPTSPGPFTAINAPATLNNGPVTLMSSLGSDIKSVCGFDYANSKSGQFMDAVATALASKFQTWRTASHVTTNGVSGTAVAGTGSGSGTSQMNGVVV